jgi:hypothetical protein
VGLLRPPGRSGSSPMLNPHRPSRRLMTAPSFTSAFLQESAHILARSDGAAVEAVVELLAATTARGGRLFLCGRWRASRLIASPIT